MQFHFHANQSHFHKNGFAVRLALKQMHKGTPKMAYSVSSLLSTEHKWWTLSNSTIASEKTIHPVQARSFYNCTKMTARWGGWGVLKGGEGGGGLVVFSWANFSRTHKAGLSESPPHYSLFPSVATYGRHVSHFWAKVIFNLVTFYLYIIVITPLSSFILKRNDIFVKLHARIIPV